MASLNELKKTTEIKISSLLESADFFYEQKKFGLAEELYKSILEKELKNEQALKGLGACLYSLKKYDEALRCFQALEKLFNNESAKVWIYATLIRLGKSKEAREHVSNLANFKSLIETEGIAIDYY